MRLTVLGCEGPFPGAGGGTSGYLVEAGHQHILLDAGSGTLAHMAAFCAPQDLTGIVLSHLHYDHMAEVLLLGYALQGSGRKLPVYLPEGPDSVFSLIAAFPCFECHTIRPGVGFLLGDVACLALPARHPVPAVGIRMAQREHILCYSGDTNDLPDLGEAYRGASLLLVDGALTEAQWGKAKPHLSAAMAARLGLDAGARQTVLTHFLPGQRSVLMTEAWSVNPRCEGAISLATYEF